MLPNLKFLVCGILFCILLFAVTGAHVMLPDSRTHIGEMPEIGRPMMQRSMAEVPGRVQDYMMAVARRSDELERLREPAPVEAVPEPPEPDLPNMGPPRPDLAQPDLPKPDVVATAASGGHIPANPTMDGSPREGGAASVPSPPVPPAETRSEDGTDEASPLQQVAVLTPAGAGASEPIPRFVNVPLPTPRPTAVNGSRRQGTYSTRRPRLAQRHDFATQGPAVPSGHAPVMPGIAAGYTPSEAAGR
jgi:hypothetical protein